VGSGKWPDNKILQRSIALPLQANTTTTESD